MSVASNSPISLAVLADPGGYSIINGMQIVPSNTNCFNYPTNLVSWWKADGNANDAMGLNTAAVQLVASFPSGQVGTAFDFDGATDYVQMAPSASLNVGTNSGFTIACWINPGDTNIHPLVEWNNGSSYNPPPSWGVHFWIYGNPQSLYLNICDTTGSSHQVYAPSNILTANVFQHVAATYDNASSTAIIYVNGAAVVTNTFGAFTPQTTYDLYFGFRPADGVTYYAGLMDEIGIFSRALSGPEIEACYSAGAMSNSICIPPPTIITPPTNQSITAGNDSTNFTVQATGVTPLSYQWQINGANISGATTSSYTVWDAPSATNFYTVIVTSSGGSTSATATLSAHIASAVADPGQMQAWYQAEGNALDSLGAFNGATMGNTTFVPGKVRLAFDFNGTNAYAMVRPNSYQTIDPDLNGMTIECWIKPSGLAAQPLVEWNNGTSNATSFCITNNQSLVFYFMNNSNGVTTVLQSPTNLLQTTTWQHVAATYVSTNGNVVIYYNGMAMATTNIGTNIAAKTGENNYSAYIGFRPSGSSNYYAGLMDEVSLYKRGPTGSEILGIYNASTAGKSNLPPSITNIGQPISQTNNPGGNATMSVAVVGSPPFSFQWQCGGTNFIGATNATLNLPFLEPCQFSGSAYTVVITNEAGSITSSNATITQTGGISNIPGAVWIWGQNYYGQSAPMTIATDLIAVAAGYEHTLALQANGIVAGWGDNTYGETTIPAGLTNVLAIAAGNGISLALRNDNSILSWGHTNGPPPSAVSNNNVIAIAANGRQMMALTTNGTVITWGLTNAPTPTSLTNGTNIASAIAAGDNFCLALLINGTVMAWGDNTYGQTTVLSGLTGVKSIAAGAYHSLTLEFSPFAQYYPLTAPNDLLLVYNTASTDSLSVLNYYLANRPMVANANVLGLATTNYPGIPGGDYETVTPTNFTSQIGTPLLSWLNTNPTKRPQYVILFLNVPSRVSLWAGSNPTNFPYYQATNDPPSVSEQIHYLLPTWSPFVTHINMNNVADCENYISKLKTTGKLVSPGTLLLSASAGGYGNSNYVIDNVRNASEAGYGNLLSGITNALLQSGVPTNAILYADGVETNSPFPPHLTNEANVAGYISWGYHSLLGTNYATADASYSIAVKWTGQSSWYLIRTEESLNGCRYAGANCGTFSKWFAATAFGGTSYANTPVAAISYTEEPLAAATLNDMLFRLWSGGNNFGICAWNSTNITSYLQAVGDPFVLR